MGLRPSAPAKSDEAPGSDWTWFVCTHARTHVVSKVGLGWGQNGAGRGGAERSGKMEGGWAHAP